MDVEPVHVEPYVEVTSASEPPTYHPHQDDAKMVPVQHETIPLQV
jgi:hypothetical protein